MTGLIAAAENMPSGSAMRPGDVISNSQVLKSVSGPKTTKLGSGRFWVIDVEFRNDRGALVGVESYTGFGYVRGAA